MNSVRPSPSTFSLEGHAGLASHLSALIQLGIVTPKQLSLPETYVIDHILDSQRQAKMRSFLAMIHPKDSRPISLTARVVDEVSIDGSVTKRRELPNGYQMAAYENNLFGFPGPSVRGFGDGDIYKITDAMLVDPPFDNPQDQLKILKYAITSIVDSGSRSRGANNLPRPDKRGINIQVRNLKDNTMIILKRMEKKNIEDEGVFMFSLLNFVRGVLLNLGSLEDLVSANPKLAVSYLMEAHPYFTYLIQMIEVVLGLVFEKIANYDFSDDKANKSLKRPLNDIARLLLTIKDYNHVQLEFLGSDHQEVISNALARLNQ